MTWDDFWWLRLMNLLTCFVAVVVLGTYLWRKRTVTPRRYRRIGWAFWLVLVVISYASGRAASLGSPIAEHTLFSAVASIILLFCMLWNPEGDSEVPPHDGSMFERAKKVLRYYQYQRGNGNG